MLVDILVDDVCFKVFDDFFIKVKGVEIDVICYVVFV